MEIEEIRTKISNIINNGALSLYFLLEEQDQGYIIKQANMVSNAVSILKNAYKSKIKDVFFDSDISIMSLVGADERKNVIYEYDLESKQPIFDAIEGSYSDEVFSLNEINKLVGVIVVFGNGNEKMTLFTKHYSTSYISNSRFLFWEDNLQLKHLNRNILVFSGNFDFIKIGSSNWLIHKIEVLEKYFKFHDQIKQIALKRANLISGKDLISDRTKLFELIDKKLPIAKKAAKISEDSPVLKQTKEKILSYINNSLIFRDEFKRDEKGRLILNTEKSIKTFLKLLNDDFLNSELTNLNYDVKAKDLISIERKGAE